VFGYPPFSPSPFPPSHLVSEHAAVPLGILSLWVGANVMLDFQWRYVQPDRQIPSMKVSNIVFHFSYRRLPLPAWARNKPN